MKSKALLGVTFIGVALAAPAWGHHGAIGMISDDLWAQIDDQLTLVESPHLVVFDEVMVPMSLESSDGSGEGGQMYLRSHITVEEDLCDDYQETIKEVLANVDLDFIHNPGGNAMDDDNPDNYANNFMPWLQVDETGNACFCENSECAIYIWEPIGASGWADGDADAIYDPPPAPGKGN